MKKLLWVMILLSAEVFAGKCGQYIFTKGVNRKYVYAPNTISQNLKKYGSSTTTEYTQETITAITDLGVTTGTLTSTTQAFSSWGPCSTIDGGLFGASFRKEYLEQNTDEIKRQLAVGEGLHTEALKDLYGCRSKKKFVKALRRNASQLFKETKKASELDERILKIISSSDSLKGTCIARTDSSEMNS